MSEGIKASAAAVLTVIGGREYSDAEAEALLAKASPEERRAVEKMRSFVGPILSLYLALNPHMLMTPRTVESDLAEDR